MRDCDLSEFNTKGRHTNVPLPFQKPGKSQSLNFRKNKNLTLDFLKYQIQGKPFLTPFKFSLPGKNKSESGRYTHQHTWHLHTPEKGNP